MKKWRLIIKQRLNSRGYDETIEANFVNIESATAFIEMIMQFCQNTTCQLICSNESEEEADD